MDESRIKYFKSKTNGAVFDMNCDQLTELDYPDLYYYDKEAAAWACEFMESTGKIVEDGHNFKKGDPIELLDWQIQTICNLYGVKQKKNKLRRYWFILQLLPKKQGKSPFSALNGIYLTAADGQGRGQIFTIAGDKMQAKIIHENAKEMIKADPYLSKNLIIRRDHIEHPASSSTFWVTSAVEDTKHGPNLSAIFEDEPHVYKDGDLDKTLLKGIIARPEPVVMYTSTAGVRNCWFHLDKYSYAKDILNGLHRDDRWLVFIYECDVDFWSKKYGDTWEKGTPYWAREEVWRDVNPSYGVTVTKDYFDNQVTLIKNKPDELNAFLRLHLNVFTGSTVAWGITHHWDKCSGIVNFEKFKYCHIGIYNSRPGDMSCICFLQENEYYWKIFCTSEAYQIRLDSTPGFSSWDTEIIEGNFMTNVELYERIRKFLSDIVIISLTYRTEDSELAMMFNVPEKRMNPVSLKGTAMVKATNLFEGKVGSGSINHGNNLAMAYQVNMTEIISVDDNSRPSSDKSRDNICCVFAALFALSGELESPPKSAYEERGMRTL